MRPQLIAGHPCGEDQPHRLGVQTACDERQRLRKGPIEPLFVIDHADERPLLGSFGEQSKDGQAEQKAVRRRPDTHAEGRSHRITLRGRKVLDTIEDRRHQLVQAGERQLHLRLHAGRTDNAAARRPRHEVIEQRRLADTGLSP
jgi:hypothetical protein